MPFDLKKTNDRWIVVGTGEGWQLCPKQSSATIIALNDLLYKEQYGIEYDILMIMDVLDEKPRILAGQQNLGDVINRINKSGKPFIAPFKYEEIPVSQPFPIKDWVDRFGEVYALNTISYMIMYAILNGAKEIETFGINQSSSSEFFFEKASVDAMIGICIGLGIKVKIHGEKSELWSTKRRFGGNMLYGYNCTFDQYERDKERYGEGVVKKLLVAQVSSSKNQRQISKK